MTENQVLKRMYSRQLKSGDWVVLSDKTAPLVVDTETANMLIQDSGCVCDYDDATMNILEEGRFFSESPKGNQSIPDENIGSCWTAARYGLVVVGAVSILLTLITIPVNGVPTGNKIVSDSVPLWMSLVFAFFISLSTTFLHELMHIIFARTWSHKTNRLRVQIGKAMAVAPMTHIWVWSFLSRITALTAGVVFDLFLLASVSCTQLLLENWILTTASSVLWTRILWQFGFHRKSDGQLIFMAILDNPLLTEKDGAKNDDNSKKDAIVWKLAQIVGITIDLILFSFWLIPLAISIVTYVKHL